MPRVRTTINPHEWVTVPAGEVANLATQGLLEESDWSEDAPTATAVEPAQVPAPKAPKGAENQE